MRSWWVTGGAGVALIAGQTLVGPGMISATLWLAIVAATFVCVLVGIAVNRPAHLAPWWALAAAYGAFAVGYLLLFPAWTSPMLTVLGQVVRLIGFPLLVVSATLLTRAQAPGGDRESAVDGAIVAVALATVLSGSVFQAETLASGSRFAAVFAVFTPLMVAAVAAATLRLLFVGHVRSVCTLLLVAAAMTGLVANVWRAAIVTAGGQINGSLAGLLLAVSYLCIALAALHPSMPLLTEPAPPRAQRLTNARLVVLGASLVAAPVSLILRDGRAAMSVPVAAAITLSLLVLWRLGRLVVDRESVRRQLQVRVERQEGLARVSRRALSIPLPTLYAEAAEVCATLLDLRRCAVVTVATQAVRGDRYPIASHADATTVLEVEPGPGRVLDAEDGVFLETVAATLAGASQRTAAYDELRRRAVHDPLTGLPNRTVLERRLAESRARSRQHAMGVTVMFIDLDGFKAVNDRLGHGVGDEVLVGVAHAIGAQLRHGDLLVRLAGDEFVVVCEDLPRAHAEEMAARIVRAVRRPVRLRSGGISIAASVGVVHARGAMATPARLLADADAAMYEVKRAGGDGHVLVDRVPASGSAT